MQISVNEWYDGVMKVGDLARVVPITSYPGIGKVVKAWDTCPDQYGFHKPIWVGPIVTVLLEQRDVYWKILLPDYGIAWVEHYRVQGVK